MTQAPTKTIKRKRLSFKRVLILLLVLYLIGCFIYYIIKLPIKNIYIIGTSLVKDSEIIETADIKEYPPIYKLNNKKVISNLKENPLIKDVEIKKDIFGKISFKITENNVLFFSRSTNTLILADQSEIDFTNIFLGIPVLINIVPNKILDAFIPKFSKINITNIQLISEIKYEPLKSENTIIDDSRFLFYMNDGNQVYINIDNLEEFNSYVDMVSTFEDKTGILNLDSITGNFVFTPYSEIPDENIEEE